MGVLMLMRVLVCVLVLVRMGLLMLVRVLMVRRDERRELARWRGDERWNMGMLLMVLEWDWVDVEEGSVGWEERGTCCEGGVVRGRRRWMLVMAGLVGELGVRVYELPSGHCELVLLSAIGVVVGVVPVVVRSVRVHRRSGSIPTGNSRIHPPSVHLYSLFILHPIHPSIYTLYIYSYSSVLVKQLQS
jgi:hypothetical protein